MFALNPTRPMSKTLRVLSALLGYPDAQLRSHLREMREVLHAEGALGTARSDEVDALIESLSTADPMDAESDYVALFDRGRGTSLHLFEHVHGDSRERGPAMIDLGETYAKAGLILAEGELPDYLPAVLEFDPNGKLIKSFGAGMFVFPHGIGANSSDACIAPSSLHRRWITA